MNYYYFLMISNVIVQVFPIFIKYSIFRFEPNKNFFILETFLLAKFEEKIFLKK